MTWPLMGTYEYIHYARMKPINRDFTSPDNKRHSTDFFSAERDKKTKNLPEMFNSSVRSTKSFF